MFDLKSQFFLKLSDCAVNKRIAIVGVFASHMSASPEDDLVVEGIVFGLLASAQSKNIAVSIPNDDNRKRLNDGSIFLYFIPGPKDGIWTKKHPCQRRDIGVADVASAAKQTGYRIPGTAQNVLVDMPFHHRNDSFGDDLCRALLISLGFPR